MTDKPVWTYSNIDDLLEKYRGNNEVWESISRAYQLGVDTAYSQGYNDGYDECLSAALDNSKYSEHYE